MNSYLLNKDHKIYQGNCLEVMEKLISEGIKVDTVICDLPFGTTQAKNDIELDYRKMWKLLNKLLVDKYCPIVFMIGGKGIFSLYNSNPKNFKYYWIVDKQYKTNHLNSKIQPLNQIDMVFVFGNGKTPRYYPQKYIGKPNHSSGDLNKQNNKNNNYGKFSKVASDQSGMKFPSNLLSFDYGHPSTRNHHQQKPVNLIEYLVKTYSLEGQTILDFTAGSGSLLQACKNTNRKSISIELDQKYIEMIIKKIGA